MVTESFIACALPYSAAGDRPFHVSLFISPTIRADVDGTLEASRIFLDWGETAATRLTVDLSDQDGTIECEPLRDPIDPSLGL